MSDIDITDRPDLWREGDMASYKYEGHPCSGPLWKTLVGAWASGGASVRWNNSSIPNDITDLRVTRPAPVLPTENGAVIRWRYGSGAQCIIELDNNRWFMSGGSSYSPESMLNLIGQSPIEIATWVPFDGTVK